MLITIFLILLGFILLILGADILVNGSSDLAKKFHIPEIIIGLTIVSIGTSMPELVVSTTSAIKGSSDIALGNVIGSNICNMILILGLSSMIRPILFKDETIKYEIPLCFIATIIFTIFCNTNEMISRIESVILLILFICFITYTIFMARKEQVKLEKKKTTNKNSVLKNIILIILGIIGLKIGGDLTVDNAVVIAEELGLSEKIISITILAIGTSLPELVTSVTAAIKGNSDIAIGNIIGSNLFNILLIIGIASIINPITFNTSYNIDLIYLIVATIVLAIFPFIPPKKEMSRMNGFIYIVMYIVYMITLFVI